MISLCLDTNTYSDYARGSSDAVAVVEAVEQVWIPAIVLGELRAGFLKGSKGAANEFALSQFLAQSHVGVAPVSAATSHTYAILVEDLRARGKPIPSNDVWIAACTLECRCPLFSYDKHFHQVTGLTLVSSPEDWLQYENNGTTK